MIRAGLNFSAADEACFFLEDAHAQFLETLHRIVGCNGGDRFRHMIHHAPEIDPRFDRRDAEGGATALRLGCLCRRDQCLGGHATEVETVATHRCALDQHDVEAELCGTSSNDEAGRAAADDADIGRRGARSCQDVTLGLRRWA